jgi:hypothetical protein
VLLTAGVSQIVKGSFLFLSYIFNTDITMVSYRIAAAALLSMGAANA